jgi:subtilisin family serine protease
MQLRLHHRIALAVVAALCASGLGSKARAAELHSPRVETAVMQAFARHGHVDAIVTVDYEYVNTPASRSLAMSSHASLATQIRQMRAAFAAEKQLALADVAGARVLQGWDFLPSSFIRFTSRAALLDMANDPRVRSIALDRSFHADSAAHLPYIHQPEAQAAGNIGSGTYVAVLDSGLDYRSADFGSCPSVGAAGCKVAERYETAGEDGQLDDSIRHGTNVASIVSQVAPGAKLLSYDVFNGERASYSVIESAINRLIQRQQVLRRIVAANLSVGGPEHLSECSGVLEGAFVGLRNAGIIPVVAAGNGASLGFGLSRPGCLPEALTVGATYDANMGPYRGSCSDATSAPDKVACFSQTGQNLDVLAPGVSISGGGVTMSGTSQATPHVAGAVAVLAAAKSSATITEIEAAIVNSGPLVADTRFGTTVSRHRLDLVAALTALGGSTEPSLPSITRSFMQNGTVDPTANTVPVSFSWSSSSSKGIRRYDVFLRSSGDASALPQAPWLSAGLAGTAASVSWALVIGRTYEIAVRATDGFGRMTDWSYSRATVDFVDDREFDSIRPWARKPSSPSYGGTELAAAKKGTSFTVAYDGTDIAWIAPKYSGAGFAAVSVDGFRYPVSLNAATLLPRMSVFTQHYDRPGHHRLKITVAGGRVDIDAFAILK